MKRIKTWLLPCLRRCPLLLFTLVLGVFYLGYRGVSALSSPTPPPPPEAAQTETADAEQAAAAQTGTAQAETLAAPEQPAETVQAAAQKPAQSAGETSSFTTVDASYFNDALFFGNSRIRMLGEYSPLGDAFYYGVDCLTVFNALEDTTGVGEYSTIYDVLSTRTFGKVYLCFGINESGFATEDFIDSYRGIIETVRTYQPDALIYVQDIMYVTKEKAKESVVFETEMLDEKNEAIAGLADNKTIFYLPLNQLVDDGTGYMDPSLTGDDVHLDAAHYHIWADYLLENAVVDSKHPASVPAPSGGKEA